MCELSISGYTFSCQYVCAQLADRCSVTRDPPNAQNGKQEGQGAMKCAANVYMHVGALSAAQSVTRRYTQRLMNQQLIVCSDARLGTSVVETCVFKVICL